MIFSAILDSIKRIIFIDHQSAKNIFHMSFLSRMSSEDFNKSEDNLRFAHIYGRRT